MLALCSLSLGFLGLVLVLLGMKCINLWETSNKKKAMSIGGFLSVCSGGFGLVCTMYFYTNMNRLGGSSEKSALLPMQNSWRTGEDIYYNIAWSALEIIGGFIVGLDFFIFLTKNYT